MSEVFFSSDPHLFHDNMWREFKIRCDWCKGMGFLIYLDKEGKMCPTCAGTGQIPARPFSSTKEMHDLMIDRHNEVVKSTDHWWCLGDLTLLRSSADKQLVLDETRKFKGHRRLVLGNHDWYDVKVYREVFEKVKGYYKIDNLLFSHIPVDKQSIGRGMVNVHGHVHTNPSPEGPYINISMEAINYRPRTLNELKEMAAEKLKEV